MRYTYTIERIEIMKHTAFTMAGAGQRAFLTDLHTYGYAAFTMADRLSRSTESVAERLPQVNPYGNTTEKSTEHCHPKLHERAAAEIRNACHAELDSASIQCCELPVTLDRFRNKFGMTPTESKAIKGLCAYGRRMAFTMAEILLSLTIIGVVAAITLPSLTGNINERTWNTQRKALYARFSQAIALMPALNGYGTLKEESSSGAGDAVDTAAETFVTNGLAKVLKINNICDNEHLEDCGLPETITPLNAESIIKLNEISSLRGFNSLFTSEAGIPLDIKAAAFETQNGESILVYYNPNCVSYLNETGDYYTQPKMCANFVYDLNGNKGPNTVGKDIGFISALYPADPTVVAPMPLTSNVTGTHTQTDAGKACKQQDSESRLPNRDELTAMFYNNKLLGITSGAFWSSTVATSNEAWKVYFLNGKYYTIVKTHSDYVRCVKR